jgi:uncharacterized protein (DUF4415 family)
MSEKKRGFKRGSRSEDELERAFSEGYAVGKRGERGFEDALSSFFYRAGDQRAAACAAYTRGYAEGENEKMGVDPDDAPEWTNEMFERADLYHGDKLIRRGRPPSANRKQALKLRIDPDVIEHFRATGPGWQTRINDALRHAAKLPKRKVG